MAGVLGRSPLAEGPFAGASAPPAWAPFQELPAPQQPPSDPAAAPEDAGAANQALQHPTRRHLFHLISQNWGICEADLGKQTGLGRNNVKYHLRQLARARLVYATASGRKVHYFPRKAESEYLREALCTLQSPSRREILRLVMRRPELSLRAVSREVGVTPRAVRWHIRQLADAGLIGVHKSGVRSEIAVSDVLRQALGFQRGAAEARAVEEQPTQGGGSGSA
jgi:DNA-binding transcriptional ArsR family regulator